MHEQDKFLDEARAGSQDAFAALYERLRLPVFRYLLSRTGDRDEAEDLLSEVFAAVANGIRSFDGSMDAFVGWVFTIARNDVADARRAKRRQSVQAVPDPPEVERLPDPADAVVDRLDATRVQGALVRLTDDQREVVLMRFVAGRTLAEVATALGRPISAVKSLQHRGLAALRRALEEET